MRRRATTHLAPASLHRVPLPFEARSEGLVESGLRLLGGGGLLLLRLLRRRLLVLLLVRDALHGARGRPDRRALARVTRDRADRRAGGGALGGPLHGLSLRR